MKDRIPARAYENLLRWANKTKVGDKTFRSGREAVAYIKKLMKKR